MKAQNKMIACLKGSYSNFDYYSCLLSIEQIVTWLRKGVVQVPEGEGKEDKERFPAISIIIYGGHAKWKASKDESLGGMPGFLELDGTEKTYVCQGGAFVTEVFEKYDKGMNGCGLEGRCQNMLPVIFFLKKESEMDASVREKLVLNQKEN